MPLALCWITSPYAQYLQTIRVNPNWAKGYARKGAALHGAHRWDEAIAAYEEGIHIEDSPALQKGLKEVKEAQGKCTHILHFPFTAHQPQPPIAWTTQVPVSARCFLTPTYSGSWPATPRRRTCSQTRVS
jgi:hypothetical protein